MPLRDIRHILCHHVTTRHITLLMRPSSMILLDINHRPTIQSFTPRHHTGSATAYALPVYARLARRYGTLSAQRYDARQPQCVVAGAVGCRAVVRAARALRRVATVSRTARRMRRAAKMRARLICRSRARCCRRPRRLLLQRAPCERRAVIR